MKNMELKRRFQNKYSIRMAAGVLTVAMLGTGSGMVYTVHAQKGDRIIKQIKKRSRRPWRRYSLPQRRKKMLEKRRQFMWCPMQMAQPKM